MRLEPAAVINAAAYTQVDRAETDQDACFRVNAAAVETLAAVCSELNCPLVQVSTDYVFGADRERRTPYHTRDEPNPVCFYGQSKLAGEHAAASWEKHYIVRTCGLYSRGDEGPVRGRNFVDTMLTLAAERTSLGIVHDQRCTPTYVPHLAQAILQLIETNCYGVYHVTAQGSTTWLEFAAELFRLAKIPMSLSPITTEEYGAAAPRPRYSVLDTSKYANLKIGYLPEWQAGLQEYLESTSRAAA